MKSIPLLTLFLFFAMPSFAQTSFYLDEPFRHPAKIPDGLVPFLLTEINSVCQTNAEFQATETRSLFTASKITLSKLRFGFILKSGHGCLTGGDNDWFWVYVKTAGRYRLVLTGGTISVNVLETHSHGLRDIAANMCTAAYCYKNIYKFNGSVYKPRVCSEWGNGPSGSKPHRVPCRR